VALKILHLNLMIAAVHKEINDYTIWADKCAGINKRNCYHWHNFFKNTGKGLMKARLQYVIAALYVWPLIALHSCLPCSRCNAPLLNNQYIIPKISSPNLPGSAASQRQLH